MEPFPRGPAAVSEDEGHLRHWSQDREDARRMNREPEDLPLILTISNLPGDREGGTR